MKKKEYIIPIFIPFLGCPHDCLFCNQVKITNYKDKLDREKIVDLIEENLSYFPKNDNLKEIAFFGGSFTGLDREVMEGYLEIASSYKKKGIIDRIRLSTRPDYINNSILACLKTYGVDIIELGIQSLDDQVLLANERGHSAEDSLKASRLIKDYGFTLGHQVMPGLFMDCLEKDLETAKKSIELGPDLVRIYPTLVIKDTGLERLYKLGLYQPMSLEEAVDTSSLIYALYRASGVNIIRVGLQPTENINEGADVVAGPFHPAMRQLVEGNLHKKYLEELVRENKIGGEVEIHTSPRNISIISGNKKANRKYFWEKYGVGLSFVGDGEEVLKSSEKTFPYDIDSFIRRLAGSIRESDLK